MNVLTPRTTAQREEVVLQRIRAIESGEFMEKMGLAETLGLPPPMGSNFVRGESTQDLRVRAAESGIILPRMTPALEQAARTRAFEQREGVSVQAAVSARFKMSLGRGGSQSGWMVPDLANVDYSGLNIAGASTLPFLVLGVPQGSNAQKIGSPDFIGGALAADTASRKTASGSSVYFTLLSAYVYALAAAGNAVYAPAAGTTAQAFASSGVAAAGIKTALMAAAFNLNTNAAIWSALTLAAPADRAFAIGGPSDPIAGIINFFFGEALLSQLVTTGAVNILGNTLGVVFEIA